MVQTTTAQTVTQPRTRPDRIPSLYAALLGLTTLAIFVQPITAGLFVNRESQSNYDSLVTLHGVTADISWVLALVTASYALWKVRPFAPLIAWATAALFVTDIVQTGIGHLISDNGQDWLLYVHVPLAFVVFGLAIWLSVRSAMLRRQPPVAYPDRGSVAS